MSQKEFKKEEVQFLPLTRLEFDLCLERYLRVNRQIIRVGRNEYVLADRHKTKAVGGNL